MDEALLKALNLCYFYLKFRPRTQKEIEQYLNKKAKRHKFSEKTIKETIRSLKEQDLINDKKFIEWFVEVKSARKPKSKYLLKLELHKLGIDKNTTDIYFEKNTQDEYFLAQKALDGRWRLWERLEPQDRFKKAASYLQRRGFSYDHIKKAIAKLETEG